MGFDKLFALLNGRPVVAHSIAAFENYHCVTAIILVGQSERLGELKNLVRAEGYGKVTRIIAGGSRRQDSVKFGLEQLNATAKYVAVHDGARPLVRPALLERVFQAAQEHGAAASAALVNDTLKRVDHAGIVIGGVDRDRLFAVQTPQIFDRDLLLRAYAVVFETKLEITDEISAAEQIGEKPFLVTNEEPNFKITYRSDLALAEFLLRVEESKSQSINK